VEFRILGLLEVLEEGWPVKVGPGKERALLAALLLNSNRPLSTERLVEELWQEGRSPENAAKSVQIYVSRLRGRLGADRILTTPAGYVLELDRSELDAFRFEQLAAEGQSHLAAGESEDADRVLSAALDLWRGEALAEFRFETFAQAEIGRLEERRAVAVADRVDARLARGRASELIGELEGLVREQPLRERPRRQLMIALYQAGRQADALDVYQAARSMLVEELGIEPSRELRDLHLQILNQAPELDLDPVADRQPVEELAAAALSPGRHEPVAPESGSVRRDSRKTVTAVSVSIELSAADGDQLDPETLRRVADRALGESQEATERHGGSLETITGESLTAVFGLPAAHGDDALRAVRAAVEVRGALTALASELEAAEKTGLEWRLGVSTGEVIATGDGSLHGRATGEPLSRSGRIAAAGTVVIDSSTYRLVRDRVVAEQVGAVWHVVDVRELAAPEGRLVSAMVGRERERRRLRDAFEQAVADRSCQLFTVLGAAGVGKSRLVHETLADIAGQALVGQGRCLPYGEGITFWPLAEVVGELVGLADSESTESALESLSNAFGDADDPRLAARLVAETIGLLEAAGRVEEGFPAVRQLFTALARTRPLVVVFDDIHWGEATFLDLVEHLAEWIRDAPILLVCLSRPELLERRPGWGGGKVNATATSLEPLSEAECVELIRNLIGSNAIAAALVERITDASGGNPLFVEETLAMMIDDGVLVRRRGRWTATGEVAALRVPPTIQALLEARLDQLDLRERSLIEPAAVIGKVFYEAAVSEFVPGDQRQNVGAALASLERKDLIRPDRPGLGGRTYSFRHLLIRDAAYASIPKQARADLHERFGRWLTGAAGERILEYEEVVGYHLEQAYQYLNVLAPLDDRARALAYEAAERLGNAARRALIRSDGPAGVNLASRAVALLQPDDPLRVELIPNVRAVQGLATDLSWADRALTEAVEVAATTGDRALAAHALVQRGLLRLFTETNVSSAEMIDVAARAIAVFEQLDDELGLARSFRLLAQAEYLARCGGECVNASQRALTHARAARNGFEEREIIEWLVIALLLGPAHAAEAAARCRELSEELSSAPLLQGEVLAAWAPLEAMLGHTDTAADLISRAQQASETLNASIYRVPLFHAFILLWLEDPARAERELLPAYERLKQAGEKSHFSSISLALSQALYDQQKYPEAERLTHECEHVSRPNDVHSQIGWRTVRARTLARRGKPLEAEALARDAVAYAETSDFLLSHADAASGLAEILEIQGRQRDAIEATRIALLIHERKGNALIANRMRDRLRQLQH
jgi:DNA-binding SARP family transcriptional activator